MFGGGVGVVLGGESGECVVRVDGGNGVEFVDGEVFEVCVLDVEFFVVVDCCVIGDELCVYSVVLGVVVVEEFVVEVFYLCVRVEVVC